MWTSEVVTLCIPGVFGCPTTVANVETVAVAPVSDMKLFKTFICSCSYFGQKRRASISEAEM